MGFGSGDASSRLKMPWAKKVRLELQAIYSYTLNSQYYLLFLILALRVMFFKTSRGYVLMILDQQVASQQS